MENNMHTAVEQLAGKRILITGGTTGIGRAIARLLGSYGARLLIFGRHDEQLQETLGYLHQDGSAAEGVMADSSKMEDIKRVFQYVDERWNGELDILINCAALGGGGLADMDDADWQYVIATNLNGYLQTTREALLRMQPRQSGHIVLVGSMSANVREAGSSVYVATKSAIQGLAESLRKEVNEQGIKVSLVEPGAVGSDMQQTTPREERQKQEELEMLRAEDIAVCVQYILTQPKRCDVVAVQIRPHHQLI